MNVYVLRFRTILNFIGRHNVIIVFSEKIYSENVAFADKRSENKSADKDILKHGRYYCNKISIGESVK